MHTFRLRPRIKIKRTLVEARTYIHSVNLNNLIRDNKNKNLNCHREKKIIHTSLTFLGRNRVFSYQIIISII